MASIQEKVDESRKYIWLQIENWLKAYYNAPVQVEVYACKNVMREGRYAKTVFDGSPVPKVYIAYDILKNGNKKEILYAGCREAVRIGLAYHKKPYKDTDTLFRAELAKHKLPDYGGLSETGTAIYTYRCAKCRKIYALRFKPMKRKEYELLCYNDLTKTECCNTIVEDAGKIVYKNEELQDIVKRFNISSNSTE